MAAPRAASPGRFRTSPGWGRPCRSRYDGGGRHYRGDPGLGDPRQLDAAIRWCGRSEDRLSGAAGGAMSRRAVRVLGLFPGLAPTEIGGVQASGRAALSAILGTGSGNGSAPPSDVWHACWGPGWKEIADGNGHGMGAHSRLSVLAGATLSRWSIGTILVWHLDLLRLVPLFRASGARVVLFLHGIEAWRRRDWLTRRLLHGVELFLSNSEHTWQCFVACNRDLHGAPHRVVPLGIGSTQGVAVEAPASVPAALMLGRLVRSEDYKGHREMIAAWPLVLRRMPGAELWIAGD